MTGSQMVLTAGLAAAFVIAGLIGLVMLANGAGPAFAGRWQAVSSDNGPDRSAGWHGRGWRRGGQGGRGLCDRPLQQMPTALKAVIAAELALSGPQQENYARLEREVSAALERLADTLCTADATGGPAPRRLAAYAAGADAISEELHMVQPAFSAFYDSLDAAQKSKIDTVFAQGGRYR